LLGLDVVVDVEGGLGGREGEEEGGNVQGPLEFD